MRLLAARSEVAAPWALPQGSHSPPLAWAAKMALVSSSLLFWWYYITFSILVNAEILKKRAPAAWDLCHRGSKTLMTPR